MGFERDVNLFRWTSAAQFSVSVAKWRVALQNRFISDAFLLFNNQLRFREEDLLSVVAERPVTGALDARLRGRLAWFGLSRAFTQELYGSVRLRPGRAFSFEPLLGIASDRRAGVALSDGSLPQRLDVGPAFGAGLRIKPQPIEGYQLSLEGEGVWQHIAPRRGHEIQLQGEAGRRFGAARLSSSVRLASRRRDTYQAVSFLNRDASPDRSPETIEATTSDTLDVNIQIEALVIGGLRLLGQAEVRANNRRIRTYRAPEATLFFESDFNRRALDAEIGLVFERPRLSAQLSAEATATTERRHLANREALPPAEAAQKTNLLLQADYDEGVFGVRTTLRSMLLPRVTLAMNGSSRIVRRDTPEDNLDDRDEIYHSGEMGLQLRLSRYAQADIKVFGSYYHTVFLNAERSAENSVQRSVRLRPSLAWTPDEHTRIRFATEVRATYTVDDFLLPGRRPSDQSAREMRLEAEMERRLVGDAQLMATASYADLHLGRLLWNEFAEIPFDTLRTYSGWVHLQTGRRLIADLGWRLFLRSDYDRAATVKYPRVDEHGVELRDENGQIRTASISRPGRRWITQMGPTAAIFWNMGWSTVRLDAWINVQRVHHRLYGALPEISAARIRASARRGTRRLIPDVTLSVVWWP